MAHFIGRPTDLFGNYKYNRNLSIFTNINTHNPFLRPFVLRLFSLNSPCQFLPVLTFPSFIFGLKPFGWLRLMTLKPYFWWTYHFLYTPFLFTLTYSGKQLGRNAKTRCLLFSKLPYVDWDVLRRILLANEVAKTRSVLLWTGEVSFSGMKISSIVKNEWSTDGLCGRWRHA